MSQKSTLYILASFCLIILCCKQEQKTNNNSNVSVSKSIQSDDFLIPSRKGDRYGFVDRSNTLKIDYKFHSIKFVGINCAYYKVTDTTTKHFVGLIDAKTGKEIIQPLYDDIEVCEDGSFFWGISVFRNSNFKRKMAWYSPSNDHLTDFDFDAIDRIYDSGLRVISNGKMGWLNFSGSLIVKCQYEKLVPSASRGFLWGNNNERSEVIDLTGKVILSNLYGNNGTWYSIKMSSGKIIEPFLNNHKWGLLTENGVLLTPAKYEDIKYDNHNTNYYIECRINENLKGALNDEGKEIVPSKYEEIEFWSKPKIIVGYFKGKMDIYGLDGINFSSK